MKKLFTYSILCITACLVLSSCGEQLSTISIAKRHYRSGYYVNIHNNKPVESKTEEIKSPLPSNYTFASISKKDDANNNIILENKNLIDAQESPVAAGRSIANNRKSNNAISAVTPQRTTTPVKMLVNKPAKIRNIVSAAKRGGGGGGLIWTIIVILIILWLLGFLLGGFGSLIYLLLVIALVLLLLRILGLI